VAVLSRGYKRRTRGYALAGPNTTALDIGDEPMQFHIKYPGISVAVGEERIVAIPQIIHDKPDTQLIILDDALQHRAVRAGYNILLTDYNNLFTRDFFLPSGDLRDQRSSYKRTQVIVVTKCPATLSVEEKEKIIEEIKPVENQHVFFTTIEYQTPYHITTRQEKGLLSNEEAMLICGIANPKSIKQYLSEKTSAYYLHTYSDHHEFSINDIRDIKNWYAKIQSTDKIIITTEKDATRLFKYSKELMHLPFYVLPIKCKFLFKESKQFNELIQKFITGFDGEANTSKENTL